MAAAKLDRFRQSRNTWPTVNEVAPRSEVLLFSNLDVLGNCQVRVCHSTAKAVAAWCRHRSCRMFFSFSVGSRAELEDCLAALEAATPEKSAADAQA